MYTSGLMTLHGPAGSVLCFQHETYKLEPLLVCLYSMWQKNVPKLCFKRCCYLKTFNSHPGDVTRVQI